MGEGPFRLKACLLPYISFTSVIKAVKVVIG